VEKRLSAFCEDTCLPMPLVVEGQSEMRTQLRNGRPRQGSASWLPPAVRHGCVYKQKLDQACQVTSIVGVR
jgi:hypothetical protein